MSKACVAVTIRTRCRECDNMRQQLTDERDRAFVMPTSMLDACEKCGGVFTLTEIVHHLSGKAEQSDSGATA